MNHKRFPVVAVNGQTRAAQRLWPGIAIVAVAFGLRLWGLTATSLWYDETFVLHYARQGVISGVRGLLLDDNAIPLHGLLVALWGQATGWSEFSVRYLSVLLGTVAVPLVYRLGRALGGQRGAGPGAALAYATLPIFVYYAQEVRMYALAIPLAAGFAWLGWRLVVRPSNRNAVGYALVGWFMLLSHLYTLLVWISVGLWGTAVTVATLSAAAGSGRDRWKAFARCSLRWWSANVALALLAVPVAIWAVWRARTDATAVSAIPVDVVRWLPVLFGVGQYLHAPWPALFAVTGACAILSVLVLALLGRRWRSLLWYLLGLTLPLALLLLTTLVKAKWSERYLLPSWGLAVVVAVGSGWDALFARARRPQGWRWLRLGLGLLLVMAWLGPVTVALARQAEGSWAVALRDEWHPRPDFRGAAAYIEERGVAGDAVVVIGGYATSAFDYYYDGPAGVFGLPFATQVLDTTRVVDARALEILERETGGDKRLWLVLWQDHLADPTGFVESMLVEQCRRLPVDASFTNVGLLLFDLSGCRPLDTLAIPEMPLNAAFQAPIRLLGYGLRRTGTMWEVGLWWESEGELEEDYTVFVHLVSPNGDLIAQHDHIAGADAYPTRAWQRGTRLRDRFFLDVPDKTCEGCRLHVGLYTPERRLLLEDGRDRVEIALP